MNTVSVVQKETLQNGVKDMIEEEMKQRGLEREYMDNTDKHLSVSSFKRKKAMESIDEKNQELLENTQELQGLIAEYEQASDDLQAGRDALQVDRERFDEEKGIYASEYKKAVETANTASEAYKDAEQSYKRAIEDVTMGYVPALKSYSEGVKAIMERVTYKDGSTLYSKVENRLNRLYTQASETAKASVEKHLSYHPVEAKEQAVQELEPVKTEQEIEHEVKVQTERRLPRQPEAQVEDDSEYSY